MNWDRVRKQMNSNEISSEIYGTLRIQKKDGFKCPKFAYVENFQEFQIIVRSKK